MCMSKRLATAESVSAGHPDKICDQISDAILDACLKVDPNAKVAVESMAGHGRAVIIGEVTMTGFVDYEREVKNILKIFGYQEYNVEVYVSQQSPEISERVTGGGAGDQGIMVGYACDETPEMLPLEFSIARRLTRAMGILDGKSQVTIADGNITRLVTSVGGVYSEDLLQIIRSLGIDEKDPRWIKNQYETTGLDSDTGLTGRKIVVDAYGPRVPVGGGAFSGKDPSKVDRSGAYMARKIAVDLLRKHKAKEVMVKIAYSIGLKDPLMLTADIIHQDGSLERLERIEEYDATPNGIIESLQLRTPFYLNTSRYGHFGADNNWDK